jgi:hypothetical protein
MTIRQRKFRHTYFRLLVEKHGPMRLTWAQARYYWLAARDRAVTLSH